MPCEITQDCVACGDCEPECPRGAISEGEEIFEIDQGLCNDCSGFYPSPHCIEVCGDKNAIVYHPG